MTRDERELLQREIIDAARVDGERPSYSALAECMDTHKSEVGRFRSGERKLDLDELVALADRYGVDVLVPLVRRFDGRVVPAESSADLGDPLSATFAVLQSLITVQRQLAELQQVRRIPQGVAADIHRALDGVAVQLRRIDTTVRARAAE